MPRLPGRSCCQKQSRGRRHPEGGHYDYDHLYLHSDDEKDDDEDDHDGDDNDEDGVVDLLATVPNAYAVLLSLVDWGSVVYQPRLNDY